MTAIVMYDHNNAIVDMFLLFRLRNYCEPCPNTAWLLFLMFALALIVLVGISMYLSKKRLNLAILGIGIVRTARLCHVIVGPCLRYLA